MLKLRWPVRLVLSVFKATLKIFHLYRWYTNFPIDLFNTW